MMTQPQSDSYPDSDGAAFESRIFDTFLYAYDVVLYAIVLLNC